VTPLERAIGAIESLEAMANSPIRPANLEARAIAASRVAEVNAAVATAAALDRIANVLELVAADGRLAVDVLGAVAVRNEGP